MADDAGYDAFDGDTLLPKNPFDYGKTKTKTLEEVSGQPTGATTGIKSVKPLQEVKPTPAPGLWGGGLLPAMGDISGPVNKDAPTLGQLAGKTKDQITSGLTKAYPEVFDPDIDKGPEIDPKWGPVGGEAAPLDIASPASSPGRKPIEKVADVNDRTPSDAAPAGSLASHITEGPPDPNIPPPEAFPPTQDLSAKTGGSESADIPHKAELTAQQGQRPGLFGMPGLLGEFGANVHNWTDQRRMQLLALAGGLAGAPSLGQGFGRGFTAAANAMPEQTKLNTQNSTVNYLMNKGNMSHDEAMAVMGNPQLAHEIMGQMSGILPPKTITSQIGQGQFQWVPGKGWQPLMGGGDIGGTNAGNAAFGNMSVPERLAHIEKMYPGTGTAEAVKAIGEYRDVAPNRLSALMPLAQKVYGESLDRKVYDQARKTIMDFSPNGISGKNITAIGTGIGHANDMVNYADALHNFTIGDKITNTPYNAVRQFFNVDDFQKKAASFKATALGTSGEMAKAFRSAGMSENDIQGWLKMFSENSSPETIHGAAQAAMHMLNVRLDEIARSYNQAMPPNAEKKTGASWLEPNTLAIRNRIMGGPQTQTPPQTQATTAAGNSGKPPRIIQNGHLFVLQPDGRYQVAAPGS